MFWVSFLVLSELALASAGAALRGKFSKTLKLGWVAAAASLLSPRFRLVVALLRLCGFFFFEQGSCRDAVVRPWQGPLPRVVWGKVLPRLSARLWDSLAYCSADCVLFYVHELPCQYAGRVEDVEGEIALSVSRLASAGAGNTFGAIKECFRTVRLRLFWPWCWLQQVCGQESIAMRVRTPGTDGVRSLEEVGGNEITVIAKVLAQTALSFQGWSARAKHAPLVNEETFGWEWQRQEKRKTRKT